MQRSENVDRKPDERTVIRRLHDLGQTRFRRGIERPFTESGVLEAVVRAFPSVWPVDEQGVCAALTAQVVQVVGELCGVRGT